MIAYLLRFLSGDDCACRIGYTDNPELFNHYDLVIIPSGFFSDNLYGSEASLPKLPLAEWEGIPILYGRPNINMYGKTVVLHADIVASAYFLLSRYEEMIRPSVRDVHGRFPGKESLPCRAGFIHRPLVDEYRAVLRRIMGLAEVPKTWGCIELTHDVDAPYLYRSPRGFVRSLLAGRGLRRSIDGLFGPPANDPYYTFPQMAAVGKRLDDAFGERLRHRVFFRAGGRSSFDKPHYNPASEDIMRIAEVFSTLSGFEAGLHASYDAGINPSLIIEEKEKLERAFGREIFANRHHFLASRQPQDMNALIDAGISQDYTMGYADVAGFRLGTARNVQWINPISQKPTALNLHPLMIMDSSLEEKKYMGLGYREAIEYSCTIIDNSRKVGGNISILWHNTSMTDKPGSYLSTLYPNLIDYISKQ